MSRLLIFHPGVDPVAIAVVIDGKVSVSEEVPKREDFSSRLLEAVDDCLARAGLAVGDLDGLGIYVGPGRFTSLRLTIAVANALAYAEGLAIATSQGPESAAIADLAEVSHKKFSAGRTVRRTLPVYGKPPTITPPKGRGPKARPAGRGRRR